MEAEFNTWLQYGQCVYISPEKHLYKSLTDLIHWLNIYRSFRFVINKKSTFCWDIQITFHKKKSFFFESRKINLISNVDLPEMKKNGQPISYKGRGVFRHLLLLEHTRILFVCKSSYLGGLLLSFVCSNLFSAPILIVV